MERFIYKNIISSTQMSSHPSSGHTPLILPSTTISDIEAIIKDYELRDSGLTQFYIGSSREHFDLIMEEIRQRAGIAPEKCVSHTLTKTTYGDLDCLMDNEPPQGDEFALIKAYGFAEKNLVGHTLNQSISNRYLDRTPCLLGIHINSAHPNYASAVKTAKDSHFKVRVIEFDRA